MPKDPVMLLSYVNTKLRDEYKDIDALCDACDAEKSWIDERLASIGYKYDREKNQYK